MNTKTIYNIDNIEKLSKSKFIELSFQDYYYILSGNDKPERSYHHRRRNEFFDAIFMPLSIFGGIAIGFFMGLNIGFSFFIICQVFNILLYSFMSYVDSKNYKKLIAYYSANQNLARQAAYHYMCFENIKNFKFEFDKFHNPENAFLAFKYALLLYNELFLNVDSTFVLFFDDKQVENLLLAKAQHVFNNNDFYEEKELILNIFSHRVKPAVELQLS